MRHIVRTLLHSVRPPFSPEFAIQMIQLLSSKRCVNRTCCFNYVFHFYLLYEFNYILSKYFSFLLIFPFYYHFFDFYYFVFFDCSICRLINFSYFFFFTFFFLFSQFSEGHRKFLFSSI